jgi:hypothetical protein
MTNKIDLDTVFHPLVSAEKRYEASRSPMYKPMLRLLSHMQAIRTPLVCYDVLTPNEDYKHRKTLCLGTPERYCVMTLSEEHDGFRVEQSNNPFNPDAVTTITLTKNVGRLTAPFVRKGGKPTKQGGAINGTWNDRANPAKVFDNTVGPIGFQLMWYIEKQDNRRLERRDSHVTKVIGEDDANQLLCAYATHTSHDVLTPSLRGALQKVREHHETGIAAKNELTRRVDSMFANDKMLIIHLPDDGGYFYGEYRYDNMSRRTEVTPLGHSRTKVIMPLTYYRTLEDMPPALYEKVMAKLTMMSVVTQSYVTAGAYRDERKFFPDSDTIIESAKYIADLRQNTCYVTMDI